MAQYELTQDFGREKAGKILDTGHGDFVSVEAIDGRDIMIDPSMFPQVFKRVPGNLIEIRFRKVNEVYLWSAVDDGHYYRPSGSSEVPMSYHECTRRKDVTFVEVFKREDIHE